MLVLSETVQSTSTTRNQNKVLFLYNRSRALMSRVSP